MQTAGTFSQDTPFSDGQIFVSPTEFVATTGTVAAAAMVAITGTGGSVNILGVASSSTGASVREANISKLLLRTGIFAPSTIQTLSGQAFGTAAAMPGPSAVAGTSGPSGFGINQVVPPVLKANLPTLAGPVAGAKPKGIQINWVDALFTCTGTVTAFSVTLKRAVCPPGVAAIPVVTTDMNAVAATGTFTTTAANNISRCRSLNAAPVMMTGDATVLDLALNYTTAAVINILGVILGVSYNFN